MRRREPVPEPALHREGSPEWWAELEALHDAARLNEPLWLRAAEWVISVAVTAFGWIAYLWLAHPNPGVFPWFVLWTVGVAWTWFGVGRISVLKRQSRRLDGNAEALWQAIVARRELDGQEQEQEQEGASGG